MRFNPIAFSSVSTLLIAHHDITPPTDNKNARPATNFVPRLQVREPVVEIAIAPQLARPDERAHDVGWERQLGAVLSDME
jgi:hypothetical protein